MANIFYYCKEDTVETKVISEMLHKKFSDGGDFGLDIQDILAHNKDEHLKQNAFLLKAKDPQNHGYLLPNVPTERLEKAGLMPYMTQLSADGVPGRMSVLHQVAAIIGRRVTRYEDLVGIYALEGIRGMQRAGATADEIKQITLRDRLARGGTIREETEAARLVESGKILYDRGYAMFVADEMPSNYALRAVMDYLFNSPEMAETPNALKAVVFATPTEPGGELMKEAICYANLGQKTSVRRSLDKVRFHGYAASDPASFEIYGNMLQFTIRLTQTAPRPVTIENLAIELADAVPEADPEF